MVRSYFSDNIFFALTAIPKPEFSMTSDCFPRRRRYWSQSTGPEAGLYLNHCSFHEPAAVSFYSVTFGQAVYSPLVNAIDATKTDSAGNMDTPSSILAPANMLSGPVASLMNGLASLLTAFDKGIRSAHPTNQFLVSVMNPVRATRTTHGSLLPITHRYRKSRPLARTGSPTTSTVI